MVGKFNGFHGTFCYHLRNIQDLFYLRGRHFLKGRFGVPSNGPVIPFGADGSNITLFLLKTVATAPVRSKSFVKYIPSICVAPGRNLGGRHLGRRH